MLFKGGMSTGCKFWAVQAQSYEAPLLNRFEKQQVDFDTFLSEDFRALLPELEHWMESVAGSSSISLTFLVFHNSIASLLLAAQHRKLDLSWVKRQLLSMCTAEALCRYHRKHRPDAEWKASAHRSLPAFLAAHSHGYELDWIIYTLQFRNITGAIGAWDVERLLLEYWPISHRQMMPRVKSKTFSTTMRQPCLFSVCLRKTKMTYIGW